MPQPQTIIDKFPLDHSRPYARNYEVFIEGDVNDGDYLQWTTVLPLPKLEGSNFLLSLISFLHTHGLKDFAKVTAISCVRNNLAKGSDDYFITTVTHTDTEDGKETSIAFYEYRPNWLDGQPSENYGSGFGQLREIAERHGLPIAFYFESESEKGELDGMTDAGIEWRHTHDKED